MTYQEAAIQSARIYYNYLTDQGRGIVVYRVLHITKQNTEYFLALDGNPTIPESVQVRIDNQSYTQEQIMPIKYDPKRRRLTVHPREDCRDDLDAAPLGSVFVISDLRFLVKRVEDWYTQYGNGLALPALRPQIEPPDFQGLSQKPSRDQNEAVNAVFSYPFTYIWGAPGTGKTRFVLARCVLAYVMAKEKVLITAPTNNALEQTLRGVLAVLEEAGISVKRTVLRLGLPSSEFAHSYPDVCENTAIAKMLTRISEQVLSLQNQIAEQKALIALLPEYHRFCEIAEAWENCCGELLPLLLRLGELQKSTAKAESVRNLCGGKLALALTKLDETHGEAKRASGRIMFYTQKAGQSNGWLTRLLLAKRCRKYTALLQEAVSAAEAYTAEEERLAAEIRALSSEQAAASRDLESIALRIQEVWQEIYGMTALFPELNQAISRIGPNRPEEVRDAVSGYLDRLSTKICEGREKYKALMDESEETLMGRLSELKKELTLSLAQKREIEERGSDAGIDNRQVVAATVDTCLIRVLPDGDFRPAHVFLDEAGYCSLIKGTALTAFDCPVTFLGDHMQLPPVCEMDDAAFTNQQYAPVSLWAQSALYVEQALSDPPQDVFSAYIDHAPATFTQMKKFDLIHTYRFGPALASILASEVYSSEFQGNKSSETSILFLPAAKSTDCPKRTSPAECEAIVQYMNANRGSTEIGVITPYKAQRDRLKAMLKGTGLSDAVMTVHGSQGREWDTVIFSVVDTTDKWFTNSLLQQSNGRRVINTAVSRARKRLIIVCDAGYWRTQKRQLIGKLLSVAKEIPL